MTEPHEQAAADPREKDKQRRSEQEAAAIAMNAWRPTPTQEECDLVAMGVPIDEVGHKDDGSGPDPHEVARREHWPKKREEGAPEPHTHERELTREGEHTREMRPGERKPERGYETR
jgi:hypothetical protein